LKDSVVNCRYSEWLSAPASALRSIFAIGDVHGCADLLQALHGEIRSVVDRDALAAPLAIHLGDYIDRGPRPLECLEMALDGVPGVETISLPGNHEQMMRHVLEAEGADRDNTLLTWLWNGGERVATELGMKNAAAAIANPDEVVARLKTRLAKHLDRFMKLPNHVRLDGYLFVHAGINPAIPLAEQLGRSWGEFAKVREDDDPLWVRGPFLQHDGRFEDGLIIVHGHTIHSEPQIAANRIGIDTGAYRSGRLTCLEIRGERMRFITAMGGMDRAGSTISA
jgi:serine/threonine protein phosphatase 1